MRMRNLEESLFWEIFFRRRAIRSELERDFRVSAATISRSIEALLSSHLIAETSTIVSYRGRPPALLQVNPELAVIGGLEFDRERITAVATDMAGNLLGRGAVDASPSDPVARTLRASRRVVRSALADAGVRATRLSRLGVGYTGRLDFRNDFHLDWEGMPHWGQVNFLEVLKKTFQLEITLGDRAQAVAFAHHLLWPDHLRHRNALYVHVGSGIGAGVLIDGRIFRGTTCNSGEIGHMVIDRDGPPCKCGKKGCLEALASLPATMSRARAVFAQRADGPAHAFAKAPSKLTPTALVQLARAGDGVARGVIEESGKALGIGIANAVQILNPSLVVLAGSFANLARDFLLDAVSRAIRDQCFKAISSGVEVRVAPFRKDIAPIGCALLASIDVAAETVQRSLFAGETPASLRRQSEPLGR
ncbi:MAG: ROK family protein [Terriglobia bacterium]